MAWKVIQDLQLADELWSAGILHFQSRSDTYAPRDEWYTLDESYGNPRSAPSQYYPNDYIYAIQVEE